MNQSTKTPPVYITHQSNSNGQFIALVQVNCPFFVKLSRKEVLQYHEQDVLPEVVGFKLGEQLAGMIREDYDA